jgi:hypothetical protein
MELCNERKHDAAPVRAVRGDKHRSTSRARREIAFDVRLVGVHAEDDDTGRSFALLQACSDVDSIPSRHADIKNDDIGVVFIGQPQRLNAVSGSCDNLQAGLCFQATAKTINTGAANAWLGWLWARLPFKRVFFPLLAGYFRMAHCGLLSQQHRGTDEPAGPTDHRGRKSAAVQP